MREPNPVNPTPASSAVAAPDGSPSYGERTVTIVQIGEQQIATLLDTSAVELLLNVKDDTVARLVEDGSLRRVKIRTQVRFTLEDVLDYIERSRSHGQ